MSFPAEAPLLQIYGGDNLIQPLIFTEKIDGVDTPIDFVAEGWTNWQAYWRPYQGAIMTLTADDEYASIGKITVLATAAQTTAMGGPGFWELKSFRGEEVRTWLHGKTNFTTSVE